MKRILIQPAEGPAPARSIAWDDPLGLAGTAILAAAEAAGFLPSVEWAVLDPTENLVDRADTLSLPELEEAVALLIEDQILAADWTAAYLDRSFEIGPGLTLGFTGEELLRAAVKFGWALADLERLASSDAAESAFVFDRTTTPTSALEHLFLGLELRRRGWPLAALFLHLPGPWEPAIEYDGDVAALEDALPIHAAIARYCGPYRLGFHDAAHKLAILPVLGRHCGGLLHLDLSGMSWLEAARIVAQVEPRLLREVLLLAQENFVFDRDARFLSTGEEDVRFLPEVPDDALERTFLDDPRGRQLLHITRGSVLEDSGLHKRLVTAIATHASLYSGLVTTQLSRHLRALDATP